MCGLFGAIAGPGGLPSLTELRAARDTLLHRGPDHQGEWYTNEVYVGHTRLSIFDLSSDGHQPMVAGDGAEVLAANGEVYNFKDLRAELAREHHFNSTSDSEVLLHGYRQWGIDELVTRIDGMYAFALLDNQRRKLYLVRDRVGIKPLYYAQQDGGFAWGSELKALRTYYGDALSIDHTALYDYLTYQYIPSPKSMYEGVHKLPPAHLLEYDLDRGAYSVRRYYSLRTDPLEEQYASAGELSEQLLSHLGTAVHTQLAADVPLGFFLSGGVDSSSVVALAAGHHDQLHTYAIGFDADEASELEFAQTMASHVAATHNPATMAQERALALVEQLPTVFDEPFADSSALPTYLVAEHAAKDLRVVLTGDGGDEVFNGYSRYNAHTRKRLTRAGPGESNWLGGLKAWNSTLRRAVRGYERYMGLGGFAYYTRLLGGLTHNEKARYRREWQIPQDYDDYWYFRQHYDSTLPQAKALQVLDFNTYLPDDILTKVDRTSMAHSLEARVPLLDTKTVEFCFRLTPQQLGENKALMKNALATRLPHSILARPKRGFGAPANVWRGGIFDRRISRAEHLLVAFCPSQVPWIAETEHSS